VTIAVVFVPVSAAEAPCTGCSANLGFVAALTLLAILLIAGATFVGMKIAGRRWEHRLHAVQESRPGALVVQTFSDPTQSGRFVKPGPWLTSGHARGWTLTLSASSQGIDVWSGPNRKPRLIGHLAAAQILAVKTERGHLTRGRVLPLLSISHTGESERFSSPIRLIVTNARSSSATLDPEAVAQVATEISEQLLLSPPDRS